MAPVLERVYGRVDILELDFDTSTFALVASVYLLGHASKHVKTIDDLSTKNKALVAALGVETIKVLSAKPSVVVGADDDWEDLDNLDELLATPVDTKQTPHEILKSAITGDHFTDYSFYSKDKASDIRDKIGIITNIKPYKQYLWSPEVRRSLDGDEVSLFNHWTTAIRHLEGYAVDGYLHRKLAELSIEEIKSNSAVVITCISLDSIVHKKDKLQFLARSDTDSFNTIYNNAIQPFYALVSLPVFNQYLSNEDDLESKFESLAFDKAQLVREQSNRDKLITELNKEKQVVDSSTNKVLTTTTTSIALNTTHGDLQLRIDTMRLFRHLDMSMLDNVASIDIFTVDDNKRAIRLRKIQQRDQYRANNESCRELGRSCRRMILDRTIVVSFLPDRQCTTLRLSIDRYGSVWIKASPSQSQLYSKNPIIDQMNSITGAFINQSNLEPLSADSMYRIVASSTTLSFQFSVSYTKVLDVIIEKLLESGFLRSSMVDGRRTKGVTTFYIEYGVMRAQTLRSRSTIDVKNLSGLAVIVLSNLDVKETALYVDILGRMITSLRSTVEVKSLDKFHLTAVDPVLFRSQLASENYSRIYQRKFQPVLTTAKDPLGVKYHNFNSSDRSFTSVHRRELLFLASLKVATKKGTVSPVAAKRNRSTISNSRQRAQRQRTT